MPTEPEPEPSFADRVFLGAVITMDDGMPTASAVATRGDRILFVGERDAAAALIGPGTVVTELDGAVLLPGFVEAHGHPVAGAILEGPGIVDIRPVTVASAADVLDTIERAVHEAGPEGAYFNGWDPLLQVGLPEPTLAWLNGLAPDKPFAILHNSGHSAYFNTAAAEAAGITRESADPVGASFGRDADGALDGSLLEAGAVAVLFAPKLRVGPAEYAELMRAATRRLNTVGITTVAELGYDPHLDPLLEAAREAGSLTARLRLYEMSTPERISAARPGDGDELVRRVGIKLWADGSPWVGNIDTSFEYLDTPATRSIGLPSHHHGRANYTPDEVLAISRAYFDRGWQLACHVHGDEAVDMVLDAWERILTESPRDDHRLRLEHVGAMTAEQFDRAARLGVTVSLLIDHLFYWGDVLVDGLFGPQHGAAWMRARSASEAGIRISFHNDGTVTPAEPLRNMDVAVSRRSRSGRILAPEERVTVETALRAETIDSAFQLFSDHEIGSIEVGKLADLVILGADPRAADPVTTPDAVACIPVTETILGGRTVWP